MGYKGWYHSEGVKDKFNLLEIFRQSPLFINDKER